MYGIDGELLVDNILDFCLMDSRVIISSKYFLGKHIAKQVESWNPDCLYGQIKIEQSWGPFLERPGN